jgi:hypothetical protein
MWDSLACLRSVSYSRVFQRVRGISTDDLDTANKDPSAPVDTPLQMLCPSDLPARAAEPESPPLAPKRLGLPSWMTSNGLVCPRPAMVIWPGASTSNHDSSPTWSSVQTQHASTAEHRSTLYSQSQLTNRDRHQPHVESAHSGAL